MSNVVQQLLCPALSVEHNWPVNLAAGEEEEFEAEKTYSTFDCYLKKIRRACVSPDSVVYSNGILVKETLTERHFSSYYQFIYLPKKIITAKKVYLGNRKKFLLVTDNWSEGHFHWICDALPKLLCIEEKASEFTLLLPDVPYVRSIALESLQLLKGKFEDVIFMKKTSLYYAGNVWYVSKVTKSGQMHPALMKQIQARVSVTSQQPTRRIYISREKAPVRKVLNEIEFAERITGFGFEKIMGEVMNLKEQMQLFASCEVLLGIHGAGLANCVLMPPGGKVIELRKREYGPSNVGYWHLADSVGHYYYYFNGIPDSNLPLVGRGCNLRIENQEFEQKVLKFL